MTRAELDEILRLHGMWLRGKNGGIRADLRESDLSGINLRGRDLRGSDLRGSDLSGINLRGSDLRRSDLRGSDLSGINLRGSDLRRSDLSGSDLRGSDLRGSDLRGSDLRGSDLSGSNLSGSDLRGSDLRGSNLSGSTGVVLLTETDHGFRVYATWRDAEWRICAGCRDFSVAEAREHWGASDYHLPLTGRRIIACLDWFERELDAGTIEVPR